MPGLPVLLDEPFDMGGLVSIGITCIITLLGIRYTPHSWFAGPDQDFVTTYFVFMKLVITFMIWTVRCFFAVRSSAVLSPGRQCTIDTASMMAIHWKPGISVSS